jgi:DNA-binding winged helix-turn-helix (wHTH) protein/Tol biopolymer transport system component
VPMPLAYRFADLELDVGRRRLERAGQPIELGKLTYLLLVALVESAPNVLTHDQLVQRVWGGRATSPETVTQRVKLLRDALQDDAERPRYIGLVRGQGYRLIPPVEPVKASSDQAPSEKGLATPQRSAAAQGTDGTTEPRSAGGPSKLRRGINAALAGVFVLLAATAYLVVPRFEGRGRPAGASEARPFEIISLTSSGRAITPSVSPDGKYVVYAQLETNGLPTSLWVRQVATASNVQIVPPERGRIVFAPTVTPDGNFIDYIQRGQVNELWRVPFIGGTPRRLLERIDSPVGWSPDGKQMAFVRMDGANERSDLVIVDGSGRERVIASRIAPAYFVSTWIVGSPPIRPAWSPEGHLIALAEFSDIVAQHIVFVDTTTGAEKTVDSQGAFTAQGVAWLTPTTLVLSQPEVVGQRIQLSRMMYPTGTLEPVTNDLSSYIGIDLDSSRGQLVTSRREVRAAVWISDASGGKAVEVLPPKPFGSPTVSLSWAGERLLYDATFDGRASIAALAPGSSVSESLVADAIQVAGAPDGSAIVFGDTTRGREGLWRTDGSGQQRVQLVSGFAVDPVVTRDRAVIYVSNRSGLQSPWIIPLDGGEATEIVRERVLMFDVSPDGRSLAFMTENGAGLIIVACELPRCSNRRELPVPPNHAGRTIRWTPDGKELAYVGVGFDDIWAVPIDHGGPHALTSFEPRGSRIAAFEWSRDGSRLALIRMDIQQDIVLLRGLRH